MGFSSSQPRPLRPRPQPKKKLQKNPSRQQVGHPLRRAVAPAGPARAPGIVDVLDLSFLCFVKTCSVNLFFKKMKKNLLFFVWVCRPSLFFFFFRFRLRRSLASLSFLFCIFFDFDVVFAQKESLKEEENGNNWIRKSGGLLFFFISVSLPRVRNALVSPLPSLSQRPDKREKTNQN